MDPTATVDLILNHLCDGEPVEAAESARDLLDWLEKGGFPPDFNNYGPIPSRNLALAFCFGVIAGNETVKYIQKEAQP
jgi:hypothetical protein